MRGLPAIVALLALGFAALSSACREDPPPASPRSPEGSAGTSPGAPSGAARDERVALFYDPSMVRGPYTADLSDVTPILVHSLVVSDHEVLRRAKMELAASGERGLNAIRRFVEQYRADPAGADYLRNAADVLSLSDEPGALPILWTLLEHPSESLRIQALRGLLVHPSPDSYEPTLALLAQSPAGYQAEICAALARFDLDRAQRKWLEWIERGENREIWPSILPTLATIRQPDLVERISALIRREDLDTLARLWLSAPPCRAGDRAVDEFALSYLREARASKNPTERDLAVRALASAERLDELQWTLEHDEAPGVRALVARAASLDPTRPSARALLELAANDPDESVRGTALAALAATGSSSAVDEALRGLESPALADVQAGLVILREVMAAKPEVARRAWELLKPRLETLSSRSLVEQAMLLKVLGQIPEPEATRTLLGLARTFPGDLEGMRAQRFLLRQSVNAGRAAQEALHELWRSSDDPLLRMDAIEAFSALGGDGSRELLLQVLDDPRTTPMEIVYVADRLVRIGPASEVAWQLKRAALRLEDPAAREALQGILWRWYPPPPPKDR